MNKPLIAITMNYSGDDIRCMEDASSPKQSWHTLAKDYVAAIEQAGGLPVLLPAFDDASTTMQLLKTFDGLVLSGGSDVTPMLYGQDTSPLCGKTEIFRDNSEIALIHEAIKNKNFPVLAICRGCQMLNVAFGGTLNQHIENHHFTSIPINSIAHTATVKENSILSELSDSPEIQINSYHHQSIKELSKDFFITALAKDHVIEAIQHKENRYVIGVQWHPEMMLDFKLSRNLFHSFVQNCSIK